MSRNDCLYRVWTEKEVLTENYVRAVRGSGKLRNLNLRFSNRDYELQCCYSIKLCDTRHRAGSARHLDRLTFAFLWWNFWITAKICPHTLENLRASKRARPLGSGESDPSSTHSPCRFSCGYYQIWVQVPKLECKLGPVTCVTICRALCSPWLSPCINGILMLYIIT